MLFLAVGMHFFSYSARERRLHKTIDAMIIVSDELELEITNDEERSEKSIRR